MGDAAGMRLQGTANVKGICLLCYGARLLCACSRGHVALCTGRQQFKQHVRRSRRRRRHLLHAPSHRRCRQRRHAKTQCLVLLSV